VKIIKSLSLMVALGLGAASLPASGLYVLGSLGLKTVYDQDINDFYADSFNSAYYYNAEGLGEGLVTLGYRLPGLLAVEGSVGINSGRQENALTVDGNSNLQINPMTTFSLGPVFCWDRDRWWFAESGVTEFGLRAEYATLSGSESVSGGPTGPGNQDFSAGAPGFGIFVRFLNIWNPGGLNMGAEIGYDVNYFNTLTLSGTNGIFAGNNGQDMNNYAGNKAYLDNSGAYIRFVFGWSQPGKVAQDGNVVPARPYQRQRRYQNDGPPPSYQTYPDQQNYGN